MCDVKNAFRYVRGVLLNDESQYDALVWSIRSALREAKNYEKEDRLARRIANRIIGIEEEQEK